ncbi:MAG: sulfatase-like hydrolase/transferase [Acidimicrobiia bacterium]|nr:sulfatase-like hydrolase/transferase [Acidimicrobiia bacterium]
MDGHGRPGSGQVRGGVLRALTGALRWPVAWAWCAASVAAAGQELPNIVIIVPDDLGRYDVSMHGGDIATPHIDSIARDGVLLSRFYSAPVCSPTRTGIMTGRYPIHAGLMRSVVAPWRDYGLDTSEVLMPEVLERAGYEHRAIFGKWHLGHFKRRWHPLRRGFTEFVGFGFAVDYFTHERLGERDWSLGYEPLFEEGYATDLLADRAVNFIGEHADDDAPFFRAPHTPTQAKEEDLPLYDRLSAIEPPRSWEEATGHNPLMPLEERTTLRRVHAAMVHALDVGIGRILDALDAHGIADNTLLLFFSDNGGSVGIGDNGPFRGCKATVYEGGIRVAAAARYVSGGRDVTVPLAYIDVLPTLMRVAGIDDHGGKPLDGVDVLDVLTGKQDALERDLYSFVGRTEVRDQVAVSEGDWKLVVIGPHLTEEGAAEASMRQLFRLDEDPLERHDVAADHPDIVARLTEKAIAFRALQPPNPVPLYSEGEGTFVPPPNWQFGVE